MAHIRLPGGTDVAEMALFDVGALPETQPPDERGLDVLLASHRLIRFPTGADGGYLLDLYVDEPIGAEVLDYCLKDESISGQFSCGSGCIAFGGLESTFREFKPNRFIRTDGSIQPGEYSFTAFHAEYPDEVIEKACDFARTPAERWLDRAPVLIVLTTIGLALALAVSIGILVAGLAAVIGYAAYKLATRQPAYKALVARREEAQLGFPSIVVEMRSDYALERTDGTSFGVS